MNDAMREYVVLDVFTSAPLEGSEPHIPFEGASDEMISVARVIFEALVGRGMTPQAAIERLGV